MGENQDPASGSTATETPPAPAAEDQGGGSSGSDGAEPSHFEVLKNAIENYTPETTGGLDALPSQDPAGGSDKGKGDEPEPKPEPTTQDGGDSAAAEDTPAAASSIPKFLLKQALELGMTDDEARAFETPDRLHEFLQKVGKPTATGEGETRPDAKGTDGKKEDEKFKAFQLSLEDEENQDPEIIDQLRKMSDHYNGAINEYQTRFNEHQDRVVKIEEYLNNQIEAQRTLRFQDSVKALDEGYRDHLGDGDFSKLQKESKVYKNLQEVWKMEDAIRRNREDSGLPALSQEDTFKRAVHSVLADETANMARKETSRQLDQRAGQAMSRPTHRQSAPDTAVDPQERAAKAIRTRMREFGMPV